MLFKSVSPWPEDGRQRNLLDAHEGFAIERVNSIFGVLVAK
jgi:hypothetical protein